MEPVGMRLLVQRDSSGPLKFIIPEWIADEFGSMMLFTFDGETLSIRRAE